MSLTLEEEIEQIKKRYKDLFLEGAKQEILQAIHKRDEEAVGEGKSVGELQEIIPSVFNDLALQVAYKDGYNKKGSEIRQKLKESLRGKEKDE